MDASRPDSRPTPRCDPHRLVMRFQKLPIITIMGQNYRLHSTEHFDRSKAGSQKISAPLGDYPYRWISGVLWRHCLSGRARNDRDEDKKCAEMSSITASLTTVRVAPATRAASKGKRATKAAAVSEKKAGASQEEGANDVFGVARKAATAAFAAAVLATTQPDVALASGGSILDAIPPAPSNGPLRNLPRGEHAPLVAPAWPKSESSSQPSSPPSDAA